jgi:hypothetical protein
MMYSGGVIFRMRMPQLAIKVVTHWGTVCEELHFFSVTWYLCYDVSVQICVENITSNGQLGTRICVQGFAVEG